MSSPNPDPLADFYLETEDAQEPQTPEADDPLAGFYFEEGVKQEAPKEKYGEMTAYGFQFNEEAQKDPYFTRLGKQYKQYGKELSEYYKGALSGLTLGASENIPYLKPGQEKGFEGFASTGEIAGSFVPLGPLVAAVGRQSAKLAAKSPVLKKTVEALANMTGLGLGGAAYSGVQKVTKEGEFPSTNDMLEHGFEWAALDALLRAGGATGAFAVNLLKASRKTGKPKWQVVNDVITEMRKQGVDVKTPQATDAKAMSIIEDMAADTPKERTSTRKVTQEQFKDLDNSIESLSEPILPEAVEENLNVNRAVENAEQEAVGRRVDSVGRRAVDDTALGRDIQEAVNASRQAEREAYQPFYDQVEREAQFIHFNPAETPELSADLLEVMNRLRTKPDKYSKVISSLEDILHDSGFKIQKNKATGAIEQIIQERNVAMSDMIELGRRLNEIINYDIIDHTVIDRLRPIARSIKRDIRTGLREVSEDLEAAFDLAEHAHGVREQKFNRESIRKIRSTEALESIPKQIETATALQDLRAVLPANLMQDVERHVLERIRGMTEAKAADYLRKVSAGFSPESRAIAEDLVRSKRPINQQPIQGRRDRLREMVSNDLQQAAHTGQRPKKALELWQNPRGQRLIKESLQGNPQKAEFVEYLQKQTLQDMAQSIVTKEGAIDFKKLDDLMKNTAIKNNLRELGGQEAVDFFDALAKRAEGMNRNAAELVTEELGTAKGFKVDKQELKAAQEAKKQRGEKVLKRMAEKDYPAAAKINKALELLGFTGKVALNLFTLIKFGFLKGALVPISTKMIQKMATNPNVRKAYIEASKPHSNPLAFIAAIEHLGNTIDSEENPEENNKKKK